MIELTRIVKVAGQRSITLGLAILLVGVNGAWMLKTAQTPNIIITVIMVIYLAIVMGRRQSQKKAKPDSTEKAEQQNPAGTKDQLKPDLSTGLMPHKHIPIAHRSHIPSSKQDSRTRQLTERASRTQQALKTCIHNSDQARKQDSD